MKRYIFRTLTLRYDCSEANDIMNSSIINYISFYTLNKLIPNDNMDLYSLADMLLQYIEDNEMFKVTTAYTIYFQN